MTFYPKFISVILEPHAGHTIFYFFIVHPNVFLRMQLSGDVFYFFFVLRYGSFHGTPWRAMALSWMLLRYHDTAMTLPWEAWRVMGVHAVAYH